MRKNGGEADDGALGIKVQQLGETEKRTRIFVDGKQKSGEDPTQNEAMREQKRRRFDIILINISSNCKVTQTETILNDSV